MTTRLLLICAANDGLGGFPAGLPAAARQLAGASRLAAHVPAGARLFTAPDRAAADTAAAAQLSCAVAPELAEADFGDWAGLTPDALAASDPQGLSDWITLPDHAPPQGEQRSQVAQRVADWMAQQAATGGSVAAIVPATIIRAAILATLGTQDPLVARRIDVPPLSLTRLTHDGGRWAWRAFEP